MSCWTSQKKGLIQFILSDCSFCYHMPSISAISLLVKMGQYKLIRVIVWWVSEWQLFLTTHQMRLQSHRGRSKWEAYLEPVVISDHWLGSHRWHSRHQWLWEAADSRIKTRLGLCRNQSLKTTVASNILWWELWDKRGKTACNVLIICKQSI